MTNVSSLSALVGRLLIAAFFVPAGFAKLGDMAGNMAYTASGGLPGWFVLPALALEIVGGLAILVGWQTRWAALALAAFTVAAGVLYHYIPAQGLEARRGFRPEPALPEEPGDRRRPARARRPRRRPLSLDARSGPGSRPGLSLSFPRPSPRSGPCAKWPRFTSSAAAWPAPRPPGRSPSAGVPVVLHEMRPEVPAPSRTRPTASPSWSARTPSAPTTTSRTPSACCTGRCAPRAGSSSPPPTATALPAGGALAVDREPFSAEITARLEAHPLDHHRPRRGRRPAAGRLVSGHRRHRPADLAGARRGDPRS